MKKRNLSIYVHIPFCVRKCLYCDFLSAPADENTIEDYVNQLCEEIASESSKLREYEIDTVFFGGGTPTILSINQFERILNAIYVNLCLTKNAEITTECNPGTVDYNYLCKLKGLGVNRLSIGLQSTNDEELKKLGRIHTYEMFLSCYHDARKAGFTNINIDLMSALPGQKLVDYEETLDKVLALEPEHISAYSLIVEEGTPFYEMYYGKEELLPDEDTDREMYELTETKLLEKGYERYEISNYSKKGFACRHNLVYWKRGEYRGFGLGSASLIDEIRFRNEDDLMVYINSENFEKRYEVQALSKQEQMEEFMFLGLRCMEGVSKERFVGDFGCEMEAVFGDAMQPFLRDGFLEWMEKDGETFLRLTRRGIDVSNTIFAAFLLT